MEKEILLGQRKIKYNIKVNTRSKGLKLHLNNGKIIVVKQRYISNRLVRALILHNKDWILKNIGEISDDNEFLKFKKEAEEFVKDRVKYFSNKHGFKVGVVKVRNQKTRWGSCSQANNLNFNYQIIKLPSRLKDYVVVHELCHTKEHNHSQKFWKLVESIIPDYKELRKELKQRVI